MKNKQCAFSLIELLLALSLGGMVCVGLFNLGSAIMHLNQRQFVLAHEQENSRFLNIFLRQKIQMAGDGSCLMNKKKSHAIVVRIYTADEAQNKLGIPIKSGTQLLRLRECVHYHDAEQYLPVEFFVAETNRVSPQHHLIDALFYEVEHHPREELITGVTHFKVRLYHQAYSKKIVRAVKINYLLSSIDGVLKNKHPVWFDGKWLKPTDYALYQPGVLFVALRVPA